MNINKGWNIKRENVYNWRGNNSSSKQMCNQFGECPFKKETIRLSGIMLIPHCGQTLKYV